MPSNTIRPPSSITHTAVSLCDTSNPIYYCMAALRCRFTLRPIISDLVGSTRAAARSYAMCGTLPRVKIARRFTLGSPATRAYRQFPGVMPSASVGDRGRDHQLHLPVRAWYLAQSLRGQATTRRYSIDSVDRACLSPETASVLNFEMGQDRPSGDADDQSACVFRAHQVASRRLENCCSA